MCLRSQQVLLLECFRFHSRLSRLLLLSCISSSLSTSSPDRSTVSPRIGTPTIPASSNMLGRSSRSTLPTRRRVSKAHPDKAVCTCFPPVTWTSMCSAAFFPAISSRLPCFGLGTTWWPADCFEAVSIHSSQHLPSEKTACMCLFLPEVKPANVPATPCGLSAATQLKAKMSAGAPGGILFLAVCHPEIDLSGAT